jgi:hypothetical protein
MESEERPSRPHPSLTRRVEGSVRVCQMTTPPCLPASPSRVVGRSSCQAGTQQLISPRHPFPSCTAPTWASIARGGNTARTQPAPSSITPANVITLYKHCVASRLLACFTVQNCDSYEEENFCCCFPVLCNSCEPVTTSRCR